MTPCLVETAIVDRVEEGSVVLELAGAFLIVGLSSPSSALAGVPEGSVWEVCLRPLPASFVAPPLLQPSRVAGRVPAARPPSP